MTPLFFQ